MPKELLHRTEYQYAIAAIGWQQIEAADFFLLDRRTSRRYADGSVELPLALLYTLRVAVNSALKRNDMGEPSYPIDVLLRLVFRLELTERRYRNLISRPILGDGAVYQTAVEG